MADQNQGDGGNAEDNIYSAQELDAIRQFFEVMTKREKEREELDFKPEIKLNGVTNGVLTLQITNCEPMWAKNGFESNHDVAFEFTYRRVKTNDYDKNPEIDSIWRSKKIFVANVGVEGEIYFKLPVYLIDYDVEFFMQCMNHKRKELMTPSQLHRANIGSFLLNNVYKVNDIVSFRPENQFYASYGKIHEVLEDNKFKILYHKLNENYDPNTENALQFIEDYAIIDKDRVLHESTDIQYEIDLIDKTKIYQNLLIKRKDKESLDIFNTLIDCYNREAFIQSFIIYGEESALTHFQAMTIFMAKNIFDYLFEPQFNYKVDCLMNSDHCGLKFINLRQSDIRTKLDLQRKQIGKVEIDQDEFVEIHYGCDSCRTGLKDWHFVYQCSTDPMNRHDICLNCVNTVIELNTELRCYLDDIFNDHLNDDCIQIIVTYVIGNVVCNY